MPAAPIALTVAGGGMTRLRVKGAALRNSLYQLTNGYVSVSQTIKVRPGTFRHTNLADTAGAGKTFGLTYFDGTFHIFASEEVDVPDGYTLHVLNHPAAYQVVNTDTDLTLHAATGSAQTGYQSTPSTYGSLAPLTFSDMSSITRTINNLGFSNGGNFFNFVINGSGLSQNAIFDHLTVVDQGGTTHTFNSSDATFSSSGSSTSWTWSGLSGAFFNNGNTYHPIISSQSTIVYEIIPLKEIHFAAPFMGFLYVAAEFDVDAATAAEWGDTFHYWVQTSGEWAADTVYQVGQIVSPTVPNGFQYRATRISSPNPGWTANTVEAVDNIVEPTTPNGYYFTAIETDGDNPTTGATEPTWPTATGATVAEDTTVGGNDVVATAAPQPASNVPSPGTGGKYTNPYSGPSKSL